MERTFGAMRRTVSIAGLLLAWLCAQGALTECLQVFAWSRMFAGYVQTMAWRAALDETLDPKKPCELCGVVRKVRQAEQKMPASPAAEDAAKIVLFLTAAEIDVRPACAPWPFPAFAAMAAEWTAPVPKPPPRPGLV